MCSPFLRCSVPPCLRAGWPLRYLRHLPCIASARVRTPAAVAAVPLVAGAAAGILLADSPDGWLPLCAAGAAVLSLLAGLGFLADEYPQGVALAVAIGCAAAGLSLGTAGARAAYRPALLEWFDARAPDARDAPVLLEGVLREDASLAPFGASITLDVTCVVSPSRDVAGSRPAGSRPAARLRPAAACGSRLAAAAPRCAPATGVPGARSGCLPRCAGPRRSAIPVFRTRRARSRGAASCSSGP